MRHTRQNTFLNVPVALRQLSFSGKIVQEMLPYSHHTNWRS